MKFRSNLRRVAAATAAVTIAVTVGTADFAGADNPATGTIPSTEQPINIEITSPATGSQHTFGQDLVVQGTTGLGTSSGSALAVYIMDVSASTQSPSQRDCNGDGVLDAVDDLNLDGARGDVLDCEIAGLIALNESIPTLRTVDVGVIPFARTAVVADVDPAPGDQAVTTPSADKDGDGVLDIEQVARSHRRGSVGSFTPKETSDSGTDWRGALTTLNASFGTYPADNKAVFVLTDGAGAAGVGPVLVAETVAAGFSIHVFVVNHVACGTSLLRLMENLNGTCTPVSDPASLSAVLGGIGPVGIDRVEISANGGPAHAASLDPIGGFEGTVPAADLVEGRNTIEATVYAADGDVTTLTADVMVSIPCDEAGLGDILGLDLGLVSGTVHDDVEPLLEGSGLEDLVHDLNCDVIDPVEAVLIEALAPLLRLLRF